MRSFSRETLAGLAAATALLVSPLRCQKEATWTRPEQSGRALPPSEFRPQPDQREGVLTRTAAPRPVSGPWLRAHLSQVRVLAVASPLVFYNGHIPGAALMPALPAGGISQRALQRLGLGPGAEIVLYQYAGRPIAVSRAFVALDAWGLGDRVAILDGGWAAWRATAGASETGKATTHGAASQRLRPQLVFVDRAFVAANLRTSGTLLIDARLRGYFDGARAEPGEPAGHIPGAVNLPFVGLSTPDGRFIPLAAMAAEFRAIGVTPASHLIVYCHSGRKAAVAYLAARLLGYRVQMYAGSWRDWAHLPPLPGAAAGSGTAKPRRDPRQQNTQARALTAATGRRARAVSDSAA